MEGWWEEGGEKKGVSGGSYAFGWRFWTDGTFVLFSHSFLVLGGGVGGVDVEVADLRVYD